MGRILKEVERDEISRTRSGSKLILTARTSGKSIELDKDATPAEIRAASKKLQPTIDDPFAKVSAADGLDIMARGGKQAPAPDDPEPYVVSTPGILQNRQLKARAEWQARRKAEKQREKELRDRRALAAEIVEGLKGSSPTAPAPTDSDDWEAIKQRAYAAAEQGYKAEGEGGDSDETAN